MRRTYANVAREFGISRQAVWRYAKDHDWPARTREFDRAVRRRLYGEPTTVRDIVAAVGASGATEPT
jgi:2-hydroxychromene-2-carboxylate isomerase